MTPRDILEPYVAHPLPFEAAFDLLKWAVWSPIILPLGKQGISLMLKGYSATHLVQIPPHLANQIMWLLPRLFGM